MDCCRIVGDSFATKPDITVQKISIVPAIGRKIDSADRLTRFQFILGCSFYLFFESSKQLLDFVPMQITHRDEVSLLYPMSLR